MAATAALRSVCGGGVLIIRGYHRKLYSAIYGVEFQ
jgi:hypothetical protein